MASADTVTGAVPIGRGKLSRFSMVSHPRAWRRVSREPACCLPTRSLAASAGEVWHDAVAGSADRSPSPIIQCDYDPIMSNPLPDGCTARAMVPNHAESCKMHARIARKGPIRTGDSDSADRRSSGLRTCPSPSRRTSGPGRARSEEAGSDWPHRPPCSGLGDQGSQGTRSATTTSRQPC